MPAEAVTSPASAITNDPNADKGNLTFYNASGNVVTSGSAASLSHMFDYAAASSQGRSGATKATIYYAFPDHNQADSQNWVSQQQSASMNYPVTASSAPTDIKAMTNPVATAASTYANMHDAAAGVTQDTTSGYAGIVQIRLYDSGPGVALTTDFWATDVYYDANGWQQVFPAVAQSTMTTLAASPANGAVPNANVTLTASVSPNTAAGTVQFKDNGTNLGTPVTVSGGTASTTTSYPTSGSHTFTAVFAPSDATAFSGSTSNSLPYVIANKPAAPTGVTATAGHGSATVSYTAPTDGGSAITGYDIQYSSDDGTTWTNTSPAFHTSTATAHTIGGLTNGVTYVFRVAAINSVGTGDYAMSNAVKPFADTSSLTISPSNTIAYGKTTTVAGHLVDTTTKAVIAAAPVTLYSRKTPTAAFVKGATLNTNSAGNVTFAVKPLSRTYYQVRYAGSAVHAAATSAIKTVNVSQVVTIQATPSSVTHGKQFRVWGGIAPSTAGVQVTLQRKVGTAYRNVTNAVVKRQTLPNGRVGVGYVFTQVQTVRGTYTYRVIRPATSTLAAGTSAPVAVRVV